MASNWKAETLDRIQNKYFESEEHDRVVRCLLSYKTPLEHKKVEQAIISLVKSIPILNSTFQDNDGKFFWNARTNDFSGLFNAWSTFDPFYQDFLNYPDPHNHPQITVMVCSNNIGFRANGMLIDVFALKAIVARFCEIYNNLDNKLFHSKLNKPHGRSANELLKHISFSKKTFASLGLKKLSNAGFNKIKINFEQKPDVSVPWIVTEDFYGSEVKKLYEIASKYKTTVENIMLAAYHRTIAETLKQRNVPINVGRQFDVRECANGGDYVSYNNSYTILPFVIQISDNEPFVETLRKITDINTQIDKANLVSKNFLKYHKFYSTTEYFQFASMHEVTNEMFNLDDNIVYEAFFTTPARYLPYLSISLTALEKKAIYLASCNYTTTDDLTNVTYFLAWLKYEVRTFIDSEDKNIYKNWDDSKERASIFDKKYESAVVDIAKIDKVSQPASAKSSSLKKAKTSSKAKKPVVVHHHATTNTTSSKDHWTAEQKELAKKYEKISGQHLEEGKNGKVKYKIKGKDAYQQRTWAEIKKFVEYKTSKK